MKLSKTFLIGIGSYGLFFLIFWLQGKQGFLDLDFLTTQKWNLLIISILWIFLSIIWESPDENTKKLKSGLLILFGYCVSLLIFKPFLNLNHREFGITYLCVIQLYFSLFDYPSLKRQIKIGFLSLILAFFVSVHFLVISSSPPRIEEFIAQEDYKLSFSQQEKSEYPEFLLLKSSTSTQKIPLPLQKAMILEKGKSFDLEYQSPAQSENLLLITSPDGQLLTLAPQSAIVLETDPQKMSYQVQQGTSNLYQNKGKSEDGAIGNFFHNYQKRQEKFILSSLPQNLQNNSKHQKLSFHYTVFLGTFIPFYHQNKVSALQYQNYLQTSPENKKEIGSFGLAPLYQDGQFGLGKSKSALSSRLGKKGWFSTFF